MRYLEWLILYEDKGLQINCKYEVEVDAPTYEKALRKGRRCLRKSRNFFRHNYKIKTVKENRFGEEAFAFKKWHIVKRFK